MAARPLLAPPSSAAAASPTLAWASPTLAWGSQGLARTFEETPRGASSFTFDAAGRAVVVDELGHRVVVLDESGKPARAVALPHPHADEVLVSRGGQLVVLDRRDTGTVSVERADGGWSTSQLSGAGVDEPRAVSRLVEHEGGVGGVCGVLGVADGLACDAVHVGGWWRRGPCPLRGGHG